MDLGLLHNIWVRRVNEPVIVFQSDDWGFNRLGTAEGVREYQKLGVGTLEGNMALKDALETEEDIQLLVQVLTEQGVRGVGDNAAVFTCNAVMGNANLEEIIHGEGKDFVAESVEESHRKLYGNAEGYNALKKSVSEGILDVQFHAWVHLQYKRWLLAFNEGDASVVAGAKLGICGVNSPWAKRNMGRSNFLAALDWQSDESGYGDMVHYWENAFDRFESVWGKHANSFIAPAYIWNADIENRLLNKGMQVVQGLPYQLQPTKRGVFKKKYRPASAWFRAKASRHTLYSLRNCYFEPGEDYSRDYVGECLRKIGRLMSWNVPIVINTHRFNYVGAIDADHRAHGLKELSRLIAGIRKQWPQAKFIGTCDLPKYIR